MNSFGGGFLISQGGPGGGSAPPSATKSNATPTKVDNKKKGSIIPLTVKKLLEASSRPDDVVEVDGVPVDQAVVVGRVYKLEEQSTRIVLHMDDSTGRIQIAYYKKTDQTNGGLDNFYYQQNMYVKAVVVVRPFKNQKLYVSNSLQTVTDYNQIAYHLLSSFLASAYRTKGPLPKDDPNVSSTQKQAGTSTQIQFNPSQGPQGGYQPMSTRDQNNKDPMVVVKETINHIQYNTDNGICKHSQLVNMLKKKLDYYTIDQCLMKLESKGEILREDSGDRNDPGYVLLGNEDL